MINQCQTSTGCGAAYLDAGGAAALHPRASGAQELLGLRRGSATLTESASDEALLARIAAGDRQAMRLLFTRHQQRIYRFVLRLLDNSAAAEDIVSDVFLEVWRQAAGFEGRAQPSTWMLAIARNKALSARRARIDQPLDDAATIPDPGASAEEGVEGSQRGAALRRCLAQLSPAHREVIDLVYYHEKSVDEVAAILDVTAATVKTRMFYARERLAELLRVTGIATARA